ncbi:hypothetical protein AMAG_06901 [Allomyces macrogynus ATCC 38327]|uniref:Uncharacterized protein n=1 Tax=Allomyces macrogynus (strain ATCC 38327) TaxID=578462 RepID=A0A0L0SFK2_ALLM3|nr:hypothetical protein AMAG_06901 [Allomyces macrogynus ATCC 38327]|eukprot:KNE61150.1 hypothetical protein AMAG_06901 [Allomyces macrogynus ATCC 38327]
MYGTEGDPASGPAATVASQAHLPQVQVDAVLLGHSATVGPTKHVVIDVPHGDHDGAAPLQEEASSPPAQSGSPLRPRSCCEQKKGLASGAVDVTPSPLAYGINYDTLDYRSKHEGFSISGRHSLPDLETPAPSAYKEPVLLGEGVPKWSIANKLLDIQDPAPGPCGYSPDGIHQLTTAPSFSMRRKTGPPIFYMRDNPPGANAYHPKMETSQIATSLKGRYKDSKALKDKTPGPANYLIPSGLPNGPHFSMVARNECAPEDDLWLESPHRGRRPAGPATYSPHAEATLVDAPVYSLGKRLPLLKTEDVSPGPKYHPVLESVARNDRPKITLKSRHAERPKKTPGPGDYSITTTVTVDDLIRTVAERKAAAAALQQKRKQQQAQAHAASSPTSSDTRPTSSPSPTKPSSWSSPGPSDYNVVHARNQVFQSTPSYSLSSRTGKTGVRIYDGPAPNAYAPGFDNEVVVAAKGGGGGGKGAKRTELAAARRLARAATMKGRLGDAVLVFPSLRLDTLKVKLDV